MPVVQRLRAMEILDSRGRPTVKVTCQLASGAIASASVPSGASTGNAEALELRDGDPDRYGGLGCRTAVRQVEEEIHDEVQGRSFCSQAELDETLVALDGTENKSRLGANAILGVSIAFARAWAAEQNVPFYVHLANLADCTFDYLPRPTINLFSGGKHAGEQVAVQDVLVVPVAVTTMDGALAQTYSIWQAASKLIQRKYGMRPLAADEGGLAPAVDTEEVLLQLAVEAILDAGHVPGRDIKLAVDVAASHFYDNGVYRLKSGPLSGAEMVSRLAEWADGYPLISIEDGLAEDDWEHWSLLRSHLSGKTLTVGDDLLCTNSVRIAQAIERQSADALLLKVNQIGTLSEALMSLQVARKAGWQVVVSARSGETEDDWLADLAVGWGADFIKIGSITRSERLAKYNRLLAIEREIGYFLR